MSGMTTRARFDLVRRTRRNSDAIRVWPGVTMLGARTAIRIDLQQTFGVTAGTAWRASTMACAGKTLKLGDPLGEVSYEIKRRRKGKRA